jgi:hypothetical protein
VLCPRALGNLPALRRGLGAEIEVEERRQAIHELKIYREWVRNSVFSTESDPDSDSSAIIVLPMLRTATKPDYRDVLSGPFESRLGVDEITFGSWLGIPELVLPSKYRTSTLQMSLLRLLVDQIPYHSRITDRTERLPVSVSILGAKGNVDQRASSLRILTRESCRQ